MTGFNKGKKLFLLFLIIELFLAQTIILFSPPKIFADASGYLRLDRQAVSSSLSGLVCMEPNANNAGQTSVVVTFPTSFTIDTNASSWTTGTSSIPGGNSAWPSIASSATSVVNKSVTFTMTQMASHSTTYCFTFSGGANSNIGTTTGNDMTGSIVTKASGTTVDSIVYSVSIVSSGSDQISVTGSVSPHVTDFQFSFSSLDAQQTNIPQNTPLSYKITYGAQTSANVPTNTTLVADFSNDVAPGGIDLLNYVTGSASNGYGNSVPVVDLTNKTITWNITNFPAGTIDQTITFQLKTNTNYTGSQAVSFTIKAKMSNQYVVMPDQTLTQSYLFDSSITGTPTSTPTPSPTPTSTPGSTTTTSTNSSSSPTITPTPTKTPATLVITDISIRSITQSNADIAVTTSLPAQITLMYGTSLHALTQRVTTSSYLQYVMLNLKNLTPETVYYFQITATSQTSTKAISEIYTFTTAYISQLSEVARNTIIITSHNIVLFAPGLEIPSQNDLANAILPRNTDYEITFRLTKHEVINSIHAAIRDAFILGFSTPAIASSQVSEAPLFEMKPGVFVLRLSTSAIPNLSNVFVRIKDNKGNLIEQNIAEIKTILPFMIQDKQTKQPIEHARIVITHYNSVRHTYEALPESYQSTPLLYTDYKGEISPVLATGTYKAHISSLGYADKTVTFTLGLEKNQEFPLVYLDTVTLNPLIVGMYFFTTFMDFLEETGIYVQKLIPSTRFFNFIALLTLLSCVCMSFLFFIFRTHFSPKTLFHFILHHTRRTFKKNHTEYLFGTVYDEETNIPVARAEIFIVDTNTEKIIAETKTNTMGAFYSNTRLDNQSFAVTVIKPGYQQTSPLPYDEDMYGETGMRICLKKHAEHVSMQKTLAISLQSVLALFFECTLILSLFIEVLFGFTNGWLKTVPFLIISCMNLLLWLLYKK